MNKRIETVFWTIVLIIAFTFSIQFVSSVEPTATPTQYLPMTIKD